MRIRETGSIEYQEFRPWLVRLDDPGNDTELYVDITQPNPSYSSIIDEQPRFARFGNVSHRRWTHKLTGQSLLYNKTSNNGHYKITDSVLYHPDFLSDFGLDDVYGYDADSFNAEAYLEMKPGLGGNLSLSNFLAELVEIKTLFKLFSRNKDLVQNAAAGHLNVSFGWKPFIADLIDLRDRLNNFKNMLAKYKGMQGHVLTSHFKKTYPGGSYTRTGLTPWCKTYCTYSGLTAVATMRYTYKVPAIDSMFNELKALLDVLGLHLSPSVIWEGVPFSFVGDWFFNIGDYLSKYDKPYLDSVVTILDYCCSVKYNWTQTYVIEGSWDDRVVQNNPTVGTLQKTAYYRTRCLPNASDFGISQSHRYGTKQIVLSAALFLA